MARTLTPIRAAFKEEAIFLRSYGYTQQAIADALGLPRTTVETWLIPVNHISKPPDGMAYTVNMDRYSPDDNSAPSIRLLEGKYEDVAGQITPQSIDLILTDPPYLVSKNADMKRANQAPLTRNFGTWDHLTPAAYQVEHWAQLMATQLKPGGSLYLFVGRAQLGRWTAALTSTGLEERNFLVWHRTNPAPQIRQTAWAEAYDLILFFTQGTPTYFQWLGQNEMHSVIAGGITQGLERTWHPTQKPAWLLSKLIAVSSKPEDIVLDPFAGSGSTGFVAAGKHRQAILVEPSAKYIGLIKDGIQNGVGG